MGATQPEGDRDRESQASQPHGLQMGLLTASLMLAVFIMALDVTILCM